jgi:hypothetical protein
VIRNRSVLVVFGVAFVAACSSAGSSVGAPGTLPSSDSHGEGTGGAEPDVPHALGKIVLGEAHTAGDSQSVPVVSLSFVPDAAKAPSCGETVSGCRVTIAPKCTESTSFSGCADGEVCVVAPGSCAAACQKVPRCEEICKKDEVCTLADAKTGEGECAAPPSFDAGPVAFSGTTTPLTLYPPYEFTSDANGAPFLGGVDLRVKAQGATGDGFEAFDETFQSTTFIQTKPSLDEIPRETIFGEGALPVAWVPGGDEVVVTVSGAGGTAECTAEDSAGRFDVPREVIRQVLGDRDNGAALTLSVARVRTETRKDAKAKGDGAQPVGWLELTTTSLETTHVEGCTTGAACGDGCVDLKADPDNCGVCGNACGAGKECNDGACSAVTCVSGPENTLAACSDGCSNDGDSYVDCDDYDCCPARADCPPTSSCGKEK